MFVSTVVGYDSPYHEDVRTRTRYEGPYVFDYDPPCLGNEQNEMKKDSDCELIISQTLVDSQQAA